MTNDLSVFPTYERQRRGDIEVIDRIADEDGKISRPHRAIDILAAMERRGVITSKMREAGEVFRHQFNVAALNPLKAADAGRPMVSGRKITAILPHGIETARSSVWAAVQAVGGMTSAGGSCLWHVIGWDHSIKEWCETRAGARRFSQAAASGILIATLGALAAHYGLTE